MGMLALTLLFDEFWSVLVVCGAERSERNRQSSWAVEENHGLDGYLQRTCVFTVLYSIAMRSSLGGRVDESGLRIGQGVSKLMSRLTTNSH